MNESTSTDENTPLPPGWKKGYSNSQKKTYYFHPETKHNQWHFPTASEAADPLKAKQRLQSNLKRRQPNQNDQQQQQQQQQQPPRKRQANSDTSTSTSSLGNIISDDHMKRSLQSHSSSTSASTSISASARKPNNSISDDATSVAIIVPYRDIHPKQNRSKHLQKFVPHMLNFLSKQLQKGTIVDYHIYIIEQSNDSRKFNRGKLLNIGFDLACKNRCRSKKTYSDIVDHDVFIFHDVDLLPNNDDVLGPYYTQFPKVPVHIARVWDRYSNNPKYFGGIVSFSGSDMKRINGYPNTFWGWGGEDDEMQKRCEEVNLQWKSPTVPRHANSTTKPLIIDLEDMNITEKMSFLRSNKVWKCNVKWEALDEHQTTWKTNGLADLDYKILAMTELDKEWNKANNNNTTNNSSSNGGGNSKIRSRATRVTIDVKLNGNHWSNNKCNIDAM